MRSEKLKRAAAADEADGHADQPCQEKFATTLGIDEIAGPREFGSNFGEAFMTIVPGK